MRRGLALLIVPAMLLFGCGGDDDDSSADDSGGDDTTIAEELGDDPTLDECIDGIQQVLESIEVPDGVDPSDGIDEDEQPKVQAEVEKAFSDEGLDLTGKDDPCAEHAGEEADAAIAEIVANLDPDVQAMLSGGAG